MRDAVKCLLVVTLGPMFVILLVMALVDCFPAEKKVEAAIGYEAQQRACVGKYATKAAIDKCRDDVKANWRTLDGGGDATDAAHE